MKSLDLFVRRRFTYRGIIQGVGFRPAVFRSAAAAGVSGFVQNRRSTVVAEVEGTEQKVSRFETHFASHIPAAARVDSVESEEISPLHDSGFSIIESGGADYLFPPIPPDLAICDRCLEELLDRNDGRYLYPFITCTECGPRYSIVADTPFDRANTSMEGFVQCPECMKEYTDPLDRRFHSQTNSCTRCGPRLLLSRSGGVHEEEMPVERVIRALSQGGIAAIQGIGGFHLAADPRFPAASLKLRRDKEREAKPFALMVRDMETARRLCYVEDRDVEMLESPVRPIVIMEARREIPAYFSHVSDTRSLGIMLPYTPLHVLLFSHPEIEIPYDCLIMTSGNLQGEPIIFDPEDAIDKLGGTAELFLYHDRRILNLSDDSVLRSSRNEGEGCIIRRSRGYVPDVIHLSKGLEAPVLAAGGDLKNSAAYGDGTTVYLSPYAGDLENPLALAGFESTVERILELYKVRPERIVFDMHPGYHSRNWALELDIPEKIEVQHHHAHILSVMAEHGLEETIGVGFDGTGYGTDGTIWGGEILYADRYGFRRLGSLLPFRLPGGEAAVKEPGRTALSIFRRYSDTPVPAGLVSPGELPIIESMIDSGLNAPVTTSAGRLFDAAAALLGIVDVTGYEGEGPIKMEWAALRYARDRGIDFTSAPGGDNGAGGFVLKRTADLDGFPEGWSVPSFVLDPLPALEEILAETNGGSSAGPAHPARSSAGPARSSALSEHSRVGALSYRFHEAFAAGIESAVLQGSADTGLKTVCLGGGVFQNMLLRHLLLPALRDRGFRVLLNRSVSPGDGGLALGQAFIRRY